MFSVDKDHFKKFVEIPFKEQKALGADVSKWCSDVLREIPPPLDDIKSVNRKQLKSLCHKESGLSDMECIAAVMAWGGQNRRFGRMMFEDIDHLTPIISRLRTLNNGYNYIDAYKDLDSLWQNRIVKGVGAAYFTKLIFFCGPLHEGYIMDQWTSKSVNLLSGEEVVILSTGYVSKKNTFENYKSFCSFVKCMATEVGSSSPEEIEIRMFSKGGKKKLPWRQYVFTEFNKKPALNE